MNRVPLAKYFSTSFGPKKSKLPPKELPLSFPPTPPISHVQLSKSNLIKFMSVATTKLAMFRCTKISPTFPLTIWEGFTWRR